MICIEELFEHDKRKWNEENFIMYLIWRCLGRTQRKAMVAGSGGELRRLSIGDLCRLSDDDFKATDITIAMMMEIWDLRRRWKTM